MDYRHIKNAVHLTTRTRTFLIHTTRYIGKKLIIRRNANHLSWLQSCDKPSWKSLVCCENITSYLGEGRMGSITWLTCSFIVDGLNKWRYIRSFLFFLQSWWKYKVLSIFFHDKLGTEFVRRLGLRIFWFRLNEFEKIYF